jgi:outer membrane protein OmpA-like peptidoglycan-associated protein
VSSKTPLFVGGGALGALVAFTSIFVASEVGAAKNRLAHPELAATAAPVAAIADHAEAPYCTPQFKQVLQRVLNACGLVGSESRRGCQPADVKTFASIDDNDFNALFTPLKDRGGIVLFDEAKDALDEPAKKLVRDLWEDRRGARYFFIVARASKTGTVENNRALSHKRANSVQFFLQEETKDPDLDKQVGMLWLGKEFAQLSKDTCEGWKTSRPGKNCTEEAVNRSAFASWVDCRL